MTFVSMDNGEKMTLFDVFQCWKDGEIKTEDDFLTEYKYILIDTLCGCNDAKILDYTEEEAWKLVKRIDNAQKKGGVNHEH